MKVSEISEVAKALNSVLERNAIETVSDCSDIQPVWEINNKLNSNYSKQRSLRFPRSCAAKLLQQINEKEIIKPFKDKTIVNESFEKLILTQHCPNKLIEKLNASNAMPDDRESSSLISNDSSQSEKMWQNVSVQVENSNRKSEASQTDFSLLEVVLDILDDNKQSLNLLDTNCFKDLEKFLDKRHVIEEECNEKDDIDDSLRNCTSLVSNSQRKVELEPKVSEIQKTEKDASNEDIFTKLTEIEDLSLVIEALEEKKPGNKKSKETLFRRNNFNEITPFEKLRMNLGSLDQISDKDEAISVDFTLKTENNPIPLNEQQFRSTELSQKLLEDNESSAENTVFNFSHEREHKRIGTASSNDTKSSRSRASIGYPYYFTNTPPNHYRNKSIIDESQSEYRRHNYSSTPPKTLSRTPRFYSRSRSKERKRDLSELRIIDLKRQKPLKLMTRQKTPDDTVKQRFYVTDVDSVKENLVEPIKDRRAISIINRYDCRVSLVSKASKIKGTLQSIIEIFAPSRKQITWLARDFNKIFPKWNMQSQLVR